MLATIGAMLRHVSISDEDLALAAGCRARAFRYREDAKKQKKPDARRGLAQASRPR
jgi:hypothetical protein